MKRSNRNNGCGDEETTQVSAMLVRPEPESYLNNKEEDKKHTTRQFRQERFPENFDRVGCEGPGFKNKYLSAPSLGQPSGTKRQNKTIQEKTSRFLLRNAVWMWSQSLHWLVSEKGPSHHQRREGDSDDVRLTFEKGYLIRPAPGGTSQKTQSGKNGLEEKAHILSLKDWRNVQNPRDTCVRLTNSVHCRIRTKER